MNKNRVYHTFINIVMILVVLMVVLPFLLLFMSSITLENELLTSGYSFVPKEFSLESYQFIFRSEALFSAPMA